MNIIKACWVFMSWSLNVYCISSIILTVSRIPDNVILAINFWPNWNRDSFNTIWCLNIRDDNIKATKSWIIIDNRNGSTQIALSVINLSTGICCETSCIVHAVVKDMFTWQEIIRSWKLPCTSFGIIAHVLSTCCCKSCWWVLGNPEILNPKLRGWDRSTVA